MALAQRLNELALANSDGLLSDDEYRLLRQSVFEQHSGHILVPAEAPLVPVVMTRETPPHTPPSKANTKSSFDHCTKSNSSPAKSSTSFIMANFLRRATGRKASIHERLPNGIRGAMPLTINTPKRGVLPRFLYKKHDKLPRPRTDTPSSSQYDTIPQPSSSSIPTHKPTPITNTKSISRSNPSGSLNNAFDDDYLGTMTSAGIREAIVSTELEVLKLIEAFNNLEQSAVRRLQKQTARRLASSTPASVDVLLEGREWRDHRIITSPSTPLFDHPNQRSTIPSFDLASDKVSVRSGVSDRTTFSQSKSVASLHKHSAGSPLSPHFRTPSFSLHRKNSVSSVSSRSASFASPNRLGVSEVSIRSHSTNHLPLQNLQELQPPLPPSDEVNFTSDEANDDILELTEIHHRRNEVLARYTERVEYLKARQKGAELRERLLRK